MHIFRIAIAVLVIVASPLAARAAGLAPSKGSQLVTAFGFGSCPILGFTGNNAVPMVSMVKSDATTAPFVIPPKKIFVINDVLTAVTNEPAGSVMAIFVVVGSATGGTVVTGKFETIGSSGALSTSFQISNGIAVKPGTTVCVQMLNLTAGGTVSFTAFTYGFFAPDK